MHCLKLIHLQVKLLLKEVADGETTLKEVADDETALKDLQMMKHP